MKNQRSICPSKIQMKLDSVELATRIPLWNTAEASRKIFEFIKGNQLRFDCLELALTANHNTIGVSIDEILDNAEDIFKFVTDSEA